MPHARPPPAALLGCLSAAYALPEFSLVLVRTLEETKFESIESPALRFPGTLKPVRRRS